MQKKVQEDPNKTIPQIYEEICKKSFKTLAQFGQTQLAQQFPSFRRCFIPPEPQTCADLDLGRDMFYLDEDHKETMIKGDTMLDDHRRVILISTDAQMETLARAKTILGDGTF